MKRNKKKSTYVKTVRSDALGAVRLLRNKVNDLERRVELLERKPNPDSPDGGK